MSPRGVCKAPKNKQNRDLLRGRSVMLFNSYGFIFVFLPITLIGYFQLATRSQRAAAGWVAAASLFFYGWWNPAYVVLLLVSILFNYGFGLLLVRSAGTRDGKRYLFIAVAVNLAVLGYYKYANFFLDTANAVAGTGWGLGEIALPLGISFFTFTQIAFLVDAYQGKAREYNLIHYTLFVSYFPHLIAGPVLHHKEMMPQFGERTNYRPHAENFAVGLTIFAIGLFKKVVLADGVAVYARPAFSAAASGTAVTFLEAWVGALSYTFQLYFDFSGYSDMAIGLSRLFGVKLPLNFHSPYKAVNIIEFWRRWHMTLSRFLRDYLYVPLGGNRKGPARRYVNLMITMVLGGLWHGAGWTFVVWGALHGAYLVVNHAWHHLRTLLGLESRHSAAGRAFAVCLTFLAVVVGWVFFRAADMSAALTMLAGMSGAHGLVVPDYWLPQLGRAGAWMQQHGVTFGDTRGLVTYRSIAWLLLLFVVAWGLPNTQQFMSRFEPALALPREDQRPLLVWTPTRRWAVISAVLFALALTLMVPDSEFLYFQF